MEVKKVDSVDTYNYIGRYNFICIAILTLLLSSITKFHCSNYIRKENPQLLGHSNTSEGEGLLQCNFVTDHSNTDKMANTHQSHVQNIIRSLFAFTLQEHHSKMYSAFIKTRTMIKQVSNLKNHRLYNGPLKWPQLNKTLLRR